MTEAVSDTYLEETYPQIAWREPIEVKAVGSNKARLACRLCIRRFGLSGADIDKLYTNEAEYKEHLAQFHT